MKDDNIFKILKPEDNEQLSKLSGSDLLDIIVLLDEFLLTMRNRIGISESVTFGTELEFENANIPQISDDLYRGLDSWRLKMDGSLKNGGEVVSPILVDKNSNWGELRRVCHTIKRNASIGDNSGGHIHIGTQALGKDRTSWLNFIKLWSTYENVIYRFVYGEYLSARPSIEFAEPMSSILWEDYENLSKKNESLDSILYYISHKRYQAVNFYNVRDFEQEGEKNTIEFRCPNGTLESIVWQNNINLFAKMLLYSKRSDFNNDIINKRHSKIKKIGIKYYNEVYLEQALEFCDLIFDNNEDKIYFLKQYLKSFEVVKTNEYKKSKAFTKALV